MKLLKWMGSSREDLMEFPEEVVNEMGHALYLAQMGERHSHVKVLSGFGSAKILEIRETDRSGTYRVVYTVETAEFIFVLHAFQKKSKSGIATPKSDIDIIKRRLKDTELLYRVIKEGKSHE